MKMVSRINYIMCFLLTGCFFSLSFGDGFLTVRTDPDGIEVWLDDNFVGDSPVIDKKLKSGRYSLKLVDPVQHSSTIEEIFIQDNENTVIEKTIKSKFGSLKVTSVPEGAQVSIATELGPTPVSNDFMNPGKYRLEIRHPDKKYRATVEELVIPRGETVSLSKTLEQEKTWDDKDTWRIVLGLGTVGGFVFGMIEYGQYKKFQQRANDPLRFPDAEQQKTAPLVFTVLGTAVGSLCLIGLEIVAFF